MIVKDRKDATHKATRTLAVIGAGAMAVYGARFFINFFGPSLPYSMPDDWAVSLESDEFTQFLSIVTDGTVRSSKMTRLKNGSEFYPAELEAIRGAKQSVNLEYYEFSPGDVGDAVLHELVERARAGVEVRVVVDAMGSFHTPRDYFEPLKRAGGQMKWYHPLKWDTWPKVNNRTHRKLMTIDGKRGFIGGAGIADHWLHETQAGPAWRDTVFHLEGDSVAGLVSAFSENWLESSGQILSGQAQFAFEPIPEGKTSFVVLSTPHGGGTQARILFQALIKCARKSITITTPYFLPDRSARRALVEAARDRGVKVRIVTAGPMIDHPVVRDISKHNSRHLLEAGAEIYEYQPSMIHAKLLTVDGQWNVVGSTNFDHRSFALNDEVNLATFDPELAGVLEADFEEDMGRSKRLTLAMLEKPGLRGKVEDVIDKVLSWES